MPRPKRKGALALAVCSVDTPLPSISSRPDFLATDAHGFYREVLCPMVRYPTQARESSVRDRTVQLLAFRLPKKKPAGGINQRRTSQRVGRLGLNRSSQSIDGAKPPHFLILPH